MPNIFTACTYVSALPCLRLTPQLLEEEEPGEDLCKCEFSLAYGAKILLSMAKLHLKKGHRYGLCGPNGAGKSTLLRAIANNQVRTACSAASTPPWPLAVACPAHAPLLLQSDSRIM